MYCCCAGERIDGDNSEIKNSWGSLSCQVSQSRVTLSPYSLHMCTYMYSSTYNELLQHSKVVHILYTVCGNFRKQWIMQFQKIHWSILWFDHCMVWMYCWVHMKCIYIMPVNACSGHFWPHKYHALTNLYICTHVQGVYTCIISIITPAHACIYNVSIRYMYNCQFSTGVCNTARLLALLRFLCCLSVDMVTTCWTCVVLQWHNIQCIILYIVLLWLQTIAAYVLYLCTDVHVHVYNIYMYMIDMSTLYILYRHNNIIFLYVLYIHIHVLYIYLYTAHVMHVYV